MSFCFFATKKDLSKNKEIGNKGEKLAVEYLESKGYVILKKNHRYRKGEIDIIGSKDGTIVFFEVKARSHSQYGYPEEAIAEKQKKRIIEAAENYMENRGWDQRIRFDVIAISLKPEIEIIQIEDAFY